MEFIHMFFSRLILKELNRYETVEAYNVFYMQARALFTCKLGCFADSQQLKLGETLWNQTI
jgi:hypothetical protein